MLFIGAVRSVWHLFCFFLKQTGKMVLQHFVLPSVYFFCCQFYKHVDDTLVIFADAHHSTLPFSMMPMAKAVMEMGYDIHFHLHDYSHEGSWKSFYHSITFMFLYAKARYVFLCDNFLPAASCKKRSETILIQLWHSCGLLKKMGYDAPEDIPDFYRGNVYQNYNLVTVSAPCCIPFLTSGMRQPKGIVQALGVSRTDVYFLPQWLKSCQKKVFEEFPDSHGKRILLWTPTFRGNAYHPTLAGLDAIRALGYQLGSDWIILIKVHPHLDQRAIKEIGHPLSTCMLPTEYVLPAVDLLITDYSSTLFDYLILERPFVLFAPDLEEYQKNRGFYVEYHTLTSYIVTDGAKLKETVQAAYKDWKTGKSRQEIQKCRQFHDASCDGNSTSRILQYIGMESLK